MSITAIYEEAVMRRALTIFADCEHPLNSEYVLLPSRRRLREMGGENRLKLSFVPTSIKLLNSNKRVPNRVTEN